jgi:large subunit ribosomal protein L15
VPSELNLSNLKPAQARRDRKRVGRGMGSGKGRYAGRGIKGQKARSGSKKMRAGFEGGQMPIYMRVGKQRGATSKDAMPVGPHRTSTYSVNLRDLERRFEADDEVTVEALAADGLIRNTRRDVKILGMGELSKKLTVAAHSFSASAREKIEAAGGEVIWLRGEPAAKRPVRAKPKRSTKAPAEAEADAPGSPPETPEESTA